MTSSLDNLSDSILQCILFHLAEDIADLLHLSRASKRYHAAVVGADNAWKRAYELSFDNMKVPSPSAAKTATASSSSLLEKGSTSEPTSWLNRYKDRFEEEGFKRRQLAAARLLKAQSTMQTLEQNVYRLAHALQHEKQQLEHFSQLLTTLQAAMHAEKVQDAHTYWVPTAVTRSSGSLVVQVPQNALEREQELKNKIAVGELECTKLERMLTAKRAELKTAKLRLQALQP